MAECEKNLYRLDFSTVKQPPSLFDNNARPAEQNGIKPCGKRDGLIDEEVRS